MRYPSSDVLVIGSGIAGLSAALGAARSGASVTIATKARRPAGTSTWWAQGGIAVAREDPVRLKQDIMKASSHTADPAAIDVLVRSADAAVQDVLIDTIGVAFDTVKNGASLHYGREAAHSNNRILHVDASTGRHIHVPFLRHLDAHDNVQICSDTVALDLLGSEPVCGALLESEGTTRPHLADATILATGGIGALYPRSTNPPGATGDGIAMALRAGAATADLEYVQFHPTVCVANGNPFLISEAVRGEGALLRNGAGKRFMPDVHEDAELAPRDIVARAVKREHEATGRVFLDVSPLDFETTFPDLAAQCAERGVNPSEGIPVVPAEHFLCGGIDVDTCGRTTLKRLYAVGECARTGVHGANRLASTSLLEGLVWGLRAGADAARQPPLEALPEPVPKVDMRSKAGRDPLFRELQHIMQRHVSLVRTPAGLERACKCLEKLKKHVQARLPEESSRELHELRSAITVALAIVRAAAANATSVGCHYVTSDDTQPAIPAG